MAIQAWYLLIGLPSKCCLLICRVWFWWFWSTTFGWFKQYVWGLADARAIWGIEDFLCHSSFASSYVCCLFGWMQSHSDSAGAAQPPKCLRQLLRLASCEGRVGTPRTVSLFICLFIFILMLPVWIDVNSHWLHLLVAHSWSAQRAWGNDWGLAGASLLG